MTDLIERLSDEADLCRNEGADDIARLLDEARVALELAQANEARYLWLAQFISIDDQGDDAPFYAVDFDYDRFLDAAWRAKGWPLHEWLDDDIEKSPEVAIDAAIEAGREG